MALVAEDEEEAAALAVTDSLPLRLLVRPALLVLSVLPVPSALRSVLLALSVPLALSVLLSPPRTRLERDCAANL